jgi:hypothetical protein
MEKLTLKEQRELVTKVINEAGAPPPPPPPVAGQKKQNIPGIPPPPAAKQQQTPPAAPPNPNATVVQTPTPEQVKNIKMAKDMLTDITTKTSQVQNYNPELKSDPKLKELFLQLSQAGVNLHKFLNTKYPTVK